MKYISNLHTHTNYCDGKNSIEENIKYAIEKEFISLGFSGHSNFSKDDCSMTKEGTIKYLSDIKKYKEVYKDKIQIYSGIEADYYSNLNKGTDKEMALDYRIGSVHFIDDDKDYFCIDMSKDNFEETIKHFGNIKIVVEKYFDNIIKMIETQKQIAERLDFLFDKIDKALKLLNENKEYVKKYRLSILKSALYGKLTRPSKNWEIKTLGEVCEINPKNKLDDNLEVSFIPMNLILDKFQNKFSYEIKKWKDIKKGYTHLQNNCIALAKITPCFENGKCVILRNLKNGYGVGTEELIIILPNSKKIIIEYIFYFMNTQFETQKEIVSISDKKFKSMEEIERLNNENIENLMSLKKSLLKEAFSGNML